MSQQPVSRLPFKSAPTIETEDVGNERCGVITFPRYNDLTVNESAWITAQAVDTNTFNFTSRLALKIAKLENVKPLAAHAFVAKVLAKAMGSTVELTAQEEDWTIRYVKELENTALKVVDMALAQQNLLVTALIRHRLPDMGEWTLDDTGRLPSELVECIYTFAQKERNHGKITTMEEVNAEIEESLGKLPTEATKSPRKRTGRKSSTGFNTSTPETETSPTTASDPSPAPTPSPV